VTVDDFSDLTAGASTSFSALAKLRRCQSGESVSRRNARAAYEMLIVEDQRFAKTTPVSPYITDDPILIPA